MCYEEEILQMHTGAAFDAGREVMRRVCSPLIESSPKPVMGDAAE